MPTILTEHESWINPVTGEPIVNGYVYIGVRNLDPVANPEPIYAERALTTPLANPQRTDENGRTVNKIWLAGRYSIKVTDSAGVQKYISLDNGFSSETSLVSANDTTPGTLNDKVSVGNNLRKTITNPSGDEVLNIDSKDKRYSTFTAAQADITNIIIDDTVYIEERVAYFKCVAYSTPNGYDIVDGDGSTKVFQLNYFQGPYTEYFVNPRHLGAVGDGSDETDILNRALSFGSIYLEKPSLYYGISSPLIYNSGVTIEGESGETNGVKIYVLDGSNITGGIFVSSGWYNNNTSLDGPVTIKNIFLHGNKDNQASGDCAGILSMNYRCLFDRVSIFKTTGDCILLTDQNSAGTTVLSAGVETEIRSCILTQPDGAGIKSVNSGQGLTDGKIHNNFIGNTGEHGIDIERSGGWTITENQIYDTYFSGIYMQGGFNTTVSGNYIQGWGSSAVNSSYYAIAVLSITSDDRPVHISDNNIVQNVSLVSGNTYYSIGVTSASGVTDAQESILNNTVTLVGDASEWFLRVSGSGVSKANVSGNNVYNLTTRRAITKGASDVVVHSGNSFDIEPQVAQFTGSPDVLHGALFTSAGGGHTISGFSNGYPGQVIRYVFNHSTNTVDFTGTNLYGNVGADWSPAVNDHMTCVCSDGTKWHCDISDNTA